MIYCTSDGTLTTVKAQKQAFPNVSFPNPIPPGGFPEYGLNEVSELPRPEGEVVTRKEKAEQEGNHWVLGWNVREKTPDELAADLDDERAKMVVDAWKAKAILEIEGLLQVAETAVAQADPITRLAWEHANTFSRTSPAINAIGASLGWTDDQLDNMFRQAREIIA